MFELSTQSINKLANIVSASIIESISLTNQKIMLHSFAYSSLSSENLSKNGIELNCELL